MTTQTQTRKATPQRIGSVARYNPNLIRRHCRLIEIDASNVAHFACYSMTNAGKETCHHPVIDLSTGACRCDCKDFHFKKERHNPTVWSVDEHLCKHLHKAIGVAAKHDMLPQQNGRFSPPCVKCGVLGADDYFETCDDRGNVVVGKFICLDCIRAAQDDLGDAEPQYPEPQVTVAPDTEPKCPRCRGPLDEWGGGSYCFRCGE